MGFSRVAVYEVQSVDKVSPAAPVFLLVEQSNNTQWALDIQLPSTDENGDDLSGMTSLRAATMPMIGGINPFIGLSMDEISQLSGVVVSDFEVTPDQGGSVLHVGLPITGLGSFQAFAAAVTDGA